VSGKAEPKRKDGKKPPAKPQGARAGVERAFDAFSTAATRWAGSTWGFSAAVASLLVWAATGPLAGFSDSWQLVINTGTTVVTFLMVFLIQRAQNRDSRAIQLKLDELILAMGGASNLLVDVERLPEKDLEELSRRFAAIEQRLEQSKDATSAHSVGEGETTRKG
jgi:low affinity Fe/Cu permease